MRKGYKMSESFPALSLLGAHTFVSNYDARWRVEVDRMTAVLSCLIGEHDSGILLADRIAYQAKEIAKRSASSQFDVLSELSNQARSRIAAGHTIELVGAWLDSLARADETTSTNAPASEQPQLTIETIQAALAEVRTKFGEPPPKYDPFSFKPRHLKP